ncbi:MAG: hypothetical protein QOI80_1985 [Solirubrobacteraceae bacterium]|jgi:hypothetical protein|nr:hypothetical protein [Solirubrobacteraceae bacterium]
MRYHGPGSPGGVAIAFKVLERALPLLGGGEPCERRAITITTAFGGPGARDGFELATRAVTDGRYVVDSALRRPERGTALERFVFRLGYHEHELELVLRDGFVTGEFAALAFASARSAAQEERLTVLKRELAERVMAAAAADVIAVER